MKRGENGAAKNVQPLKNVAASGVDANPSSDCLSRSIEAHGGKQAPFYPVHSRQRERWTDGAPRLRRLRYTLSLSRCVSLPLSLSLRGAVSFFPPGPPVSFLFQLVLVSFSFRGLAQDPPREHTERRSSGNGRIDPSIIGDGNARRGSSAMQISRTWFTTFFSILLTSSCTQVTETKLDRGPAGNTTTSCVVLARHASVDVALRNIFFLLSFGARVPFIPVRARSADRRGTGSSFRARGTTTRTITAARCQFDHRG